MNKYIVAAIAFLFFTAVLHAKDLNPAGAGAKAEGMGGAFIGIADDATSLVWNPAGLAQLSKAEASVVSRLAFIFYDDADKYHQKSYNTDCKPVVLNFASLAVPIKIGNSTIVAAIGYHRPLDFNTEMEPYFNMISGNGGVMTLTPGFGIKLGSMLSFGASVNFWMGKSEVLWEGNTFELQLDKLTYRGVNFVGGVMVDLEGLANPLPAKLGISVRTPFNLKGTGTFDDFSPYPSAQPEPIEQTLHMPLMMGIGVSVRPLPGLILAADYDARFYRDKQKLSKFTELWNGGYPIGDYDLNEYRFGAEYKILSGNIYFPLRLGYRSLPTLYSNFDSRGAKRQVIGSSIIVGGGVSFRQFEFDAAYTSSAYTIHFSSDAALFYSSGTISTSLIYHLD